MTVHLQRDLDNLKKDIVHLGSLVQSSTQSVVEFLGTKSEQQLNPFLNMRTVSTGSRSTSRRTA